MKRWIKYFLCCFIQLSVGSLVAQNGAKRPFPWHDSIIYHKGTILPVMSQDSLNINTESFYRQWKARYVIKVSGANPEQAYIWNEQAGRREKKWINTSEGQGYGMIIVALMAGYDTEAKKTYDALYNYYYLHRTNTDTSSALMSWHQKKRDGNNYARGDDDAATDGDIDIAYSLLLAYRQWGNSADTLYLSSFNKLVADIKKHEINLKQFYLLLSDDDTDPVNDPTYFVARSSDFMPATFKSFATFTKDATWDSVVIKNYALLKTIQNEHSSGLVPDFIIGLNAEPSIPSGKIAETKYDGAYYHNACRVPWRIATDYILNGSKEAKAFIEKINHWVENEAGKMLNVNQLSEGYDLSGKPLSKKHTANYPVMSYVCPFAVAAMIDSSNQRWLNHLYRYINDFKITYVKADASNNYRELPGKDEPASHDYYNNTIKMFTMIILSGNYWQP